MCWCPQYLGFLGIGVLSHLQMLIFILVCWAPSLGVCTLGRGRTDKKLTSTLVIQTFLSFDLPHIFLKCGSRLFFKKAKKNSGFHPHRRWWRKHDPLDPSWQDYAISPPDRLHFLGLSLYGGITSVCSNSGKTALVQFAACATQARFCNMKDSDTHSRV